MTLKELESLMHEGAEKFGVIVEHAKTLTDIDLTAEDFVQKSYEQMSDLPSDRAADITGYWFIAGATAALAARKKAQ
jgi:hypothetical protein